MAEQWLTSAVPMLLGHVTPGLGPSPYPRRQPKTLTSEAAMQLNTCRVQHGAAPDRHSAQRVIQGSHQEPKRQHQMKHPKRPERP